MAGRREGRLHPVRSHSIDLVATGDGPPGPQEQFESPMIDGKPGCEVEFIRSRDRVKQPHKKAAALRGRLQTRDELIQFYVDQANNEAAPTADRIRAADRIVDLLGFKISKDFGSVQKMTNSELVAAVEKVATLIEGFMTLRARGQGADNITQPEVAHP